MTMTNDRTEGPRVLIDQHRARQTTLVTLTFIVCALCAFATPAGAANKAGVDEIFLRRVEAMEKRIGDQDALLMAQAKQIAAQQAQLNALESMTAQKIASLPTSALVGARVGARVGASESDAKRIAVLEDQALKASVLESDRPHISMALGRPTIASADDRYTFSPRAVVQLDAAHYDQQSRAAATDFRRGSVGAANNRDTAAAQDLSDGAYFRRSRFGFEGTFERDFSYRLMLELAGSGTEGPARINDAWVSYTGLAPWTVQIGAFSPPANMADGTSVEDLLFAERPAVAELSRTLAGADGRIGVGVRYDAQRGMAALTGTGRTVNDAEVFDSQFAMVGRTSWLAFTDESTYNVHLGASLTYVLTPPDAGNTAGTARYALRLRERPEIRVDSARLIDSGAIDAAHASVIGGEFGANWRSLLLQGEYFAFDFAKRKPITPHDLEFSGWYLEGSWVITGEMHRYNVRSGAFQSPRPTRLFAPLQDGWGAWELAVRYSHANLNDNPGVRGQALALGGIRGGEQNIWSLGLNGYLTPNVRVMFSYLDVSVDRLNPKGTASATPFGAGTLTPPTGVDVGQDLKVWTMRTQFSF